MTPRSLHTASFSYRKASTVSVEVQFPGRRGVDERGRPFESALLSERVITVAVIDEAKRRGVRVADEESGMSMGIVEQLGTGGEMRYRIDFSKTLSTCFTRHGNTGGWQEAHFHEGASEDYLVDSGKLFLVWIDPDTKLQKQRRLGPGDRHTFAPGVIHKVYALANTVTQVTRRGSSSQDRVLVRELDLLIDALNLSEATMFGGPAKSDGTG